MEQNSKFLFLFQTIASLWFLLLVYTSLIWVWMLLLHQETRARKGPGLNLKEL
jgi:hypothetical protein